MTQSEKLANSLIQLRELQKKGMVAIRSRDLTRTHLKRLVKSGFLKEIIKGWYISSRPDEIQGDSTSWYISFWDFCASYLNKRFGNAWCLSPEQSLLIHAENWTIPRQLLVRTKKGNNKVTHLLFGTSLLDVRYTMPKKNEMEEKNGLKIYAKTSALIASSPSFFIHNPTDARTILATIQDASEILSPLLESGHTTIAGRLVGAFKNTGQNRIAEDIKKTMISAGYDIREKDPFEAEIKLQFSNSVVSPYIHRMRILWQEMRKPIIDFFPKQPNIHLDTKSYLENIDATYVQDAYNSLSIEGYQVTHELIEKVRSGQWNPDKDEGDHSHKNALAARGYWQAFQAVKASIQKILMGENFGKVAWDDHGEWFRELFAPSVTAGILRPTELAGYRRHPVYIRCSMHVPPNFLALPELMHTFFDLLEHETEASVRIVLGHFFFVFIHPYMDGNGRIGRFLMNLMCASGGFSWIIVPVERRKQYMDALEKASVEQNIIPFCDFLRAEIRISEIEQTWKKINFDEKTSKTWISILEKDKKQKDDVVYWSYKAIKDFFNLSSEEFSSILEKAKMYLTTQRGLIEINHFEESDSPESYRLTRYACFSIAKILERDKFLETKAEFALFYFGGWPCNPDSFNNRIKEGKKAGVGEILLNLNQDFKGFSNIRR